jgi:membrane-bound ClpP family serine protease
MNTYRVSFIQFVLEQLTNTFRLFTKIGIVFLIFELLWGFPSNLKSDEFSLARLALTILVSYSLSIFCWVIVLKIKQKNSR